MISPKPLSLADISTQDVDWLWPGRIPLGKITLLVGDPGVGKSLLALDIAARLTAARPWPDARKGGASKAEGGMNAAPSPNPQSLTPIPPSAFPPPHSPSSVLLLSAEDDLADTIRPRLEAAGADCSRIVALAAWARFSESGARCAPVRSADALPAYSPPDKNGISWPLPTPRLPRLSEADAEVQDAIDELDRALADRPDCRLVIIDPLSAYLGRGIENSNSEVRRWLAPLGQLAARRRVAMVAVHHLRKQAGSALHRTMGSLAFVAAARAAWLVAPDPSDASRRLLLPMKNNLAARGAPLPFTIASRDDGQPVIEWSTSESALTADEALRPAKNPVPTGRPSFERDDAVRWLQTALAKGVQPSAQIEEQAAAHGISIKTLRRAFRELGGEAVKSGFWPGEWYWRLPGVGEQEPQPTFGHLRLDLGEIGPSPVTGL